MFSYQSQKKHGVIAASAGNHAQALAYHGNALKIPVTVVMPDDAPIVKQAMCKEYGANVLIVGHNLQEVSSLKIIFQILARVVNNNDGVSSIQETKYRRPLQAAECGL